jgi:hypothetical protein
MLTKPYVSREIQLSLLFLGNNTVGYFREIETVISSKKTFSRPTVRVGTL